MQSRCGSLENHWNFFPPLISHTLREAGRMLADAELRIPVLSNMALMLSRTIQSKDDFTGNTTKSN